MYNWKKSTAGEQKADVFPVVSMENYNLCQFYRFKLVLRPTAHHLKGKLRTDPEILAQVYIMRIPPMVLQKDIHPLMEKLYIKKREPNRHFCFY